jgi:hypothetical protein
MVVVRWLYCPISLFRSPIDSVGSAHLCSIILGQECDEERVDLERTQTVPKERNKRSHNRDFLFLYPETNITGQLYVHSCWGGGMLIGNLEGTKCPLGFLTKDPLGGI